MNRSSGRPRNPSAKALEAAANAATEHAPAPQKTSAKNSAALKASSDAQALLKSKTSAISKSAVLQSVRPKGIARLTKPTKAKTRTDAKTTSKAASKKETAPVITGPAKVKASKPQKAPTAQSKATVTKKPASKQPASKKAATKKLTIETSAPKKPTKKKPVAKNPAEKSLAKFVEKDLNGKPAEELTDKSPAAKKPKEANKCAGSKDRERILSAKALDGAFPFIEERIIGERKAPVDNRRDEHEYLISSIPQWINSNQVDKDMIADWEAKREEMVMLEKVPFSEMRVTRGHPVLDEHSAMATQEWKEAKSFELAREIQRKEFGIDATRALQMLAIIILEAMRPDQLLRGAELYDYADSESRAIAVEKGLGTAPELACTLVNWGWDGTLVTKMQNDIRLRQIRLVFQNDDDDDEAELSTTISADELFNGAFASILPLYIPTEVNNKAKHGAQFKLDTTFKQRREIGRRLLATMPHIQSFSSSAWLRLLVTMFIPFDDLVEIKPQWKGHKAVYWQGTAVDSCLSQFCVQSGTEGETYIGDTLPTFVQLTEYLSPEMDMDYSVDDNENENDLSKNGGKVPDPDNKKYGSSDEASMEDAENGDDQNHAPSAARISRKRKRARKGEIVSMSNSRKARKQ